MMRSLMPRTSGSSEETIIIGEVEELESLRQPELEQIADDRLQIADDSSGNLEDVLSGIEIVSTQPEDPEQITEDGQMSLF